MDQYAVRPEALESYAAIIDGQRERLAAAGTALAGVRVPDGAFGGLPDADALERSCRAQAAGTRRHVRDLLEVLEHVAAGLRANAEEYRQAEQDAAAGLGGGVP